MKHERDGEGEEILRVMTFNIRHGLGKRGFKPWAKTRKKRVLHNLMNIAGVLLEEKPHVVMLQEVDEKSFLTGGFNQAEKLANGACYFHYFLGEHVKAGGLYYGTALLSRYALHNPRSVRLRTRLPVFKKGFVQATVSLPQFGDEMMDLVSVHFSAADLRPKRTRREQAGHLVDALRNKREQRSLIIGGDFNCGYMAREDTLRYIADELELQIPSEIGESAKLPNGNGRCIDWILVSQEFDVKDCYYVPERFSDHYPLIVELGKRKE